MVLPYSRSMLRSWAWIPSSTVGIRTPLVEEPPLQQRPFCLVARQIERAQLLSACLVETAEVVQQLGAGRVEDVVAIELKRDLVKVAHGGFRSIQVPDGDGAIEPH